DPILVYPFQKYSPVATNNYPLTKVNDNTYIEGYWTQYGHPYCDTDYPTPLPNDIPVDKNFLYKLEKITKDAKCIDYFGTSTCRICHCNNGGSEYSLEKNDIILFQ